MNAVPNEAPDNTEIPNGRQHPCVTCGETGSAVSLAENERQSTEGSVPVADGRLERVSVYLKQGLFTYSSQVSDESNKHGCAVITARKASLPLSAIGRQPIGAL